MARISCAGVLLLAGTLSTIGSLSAQTQACSGTQDFSGPYVFTAVRLAYVAQSTTPPGTTVTPPIFVPQPTAAPGTTGQYSVTPIGRLVGWASNASPFSSAGRIFADGAGVLYSQKLNDTLFVNVGTYSVTSECVINMTIKDGFSTDKDPRPSVTFQGVLTDRGSEATVIQSSLGSGVLLRFSRPFLATGCSTANLGGRYGLFGLGVDLGTPVAGSTTPAPTTALTFANQFTADSAGVIGSTIATTPAGYTGSYTVNSDCTGALTLISPDKATTRKFAFVLTSSPIVAGQVPKAGIDLVLDALGQFAGFAEAR